MRAVVRRDVKLHEPPAVTCISALIQAGGASVKRLVRDPERVHHDRLIDLAVGIVRALVAEDVNAAIVVDGHAVGERLDPTQAIVPFASAFKRTEVASVPHQTVRLDVPRDHVNAVRVAGDSGRAASASFRPGDATPRVPDRA